MERHGTYEQASETLANTGNPREPEAAATALGSGDFVYGCEEVGHSGNRLDDFLADATGAEVQPTVLRHKDIAAVQAPMLKLGGALCTRDEVFQADARDSETVNADLFCRIFMAEPALADRIFHRTNAVEFYVLG